MKCIIGRKNSLLLIGAKIRNVPLKNSNLPLLTSILLYFISLYVMDQIWTWHVCTALTFVRSIYHVSSIWHMSSIWHVSWVNGDIRSDRISIHQIYSLFVCVYNSQKINPLSQNATIFAPKYHGICPKYHSIAPKTTVVATNTTVFASNSTVFTPNPTVYGPNTAVFAPKYYCICPIHNLFFSPK